MSPKSPIPTHATTGRIGDDIKLNEAAFLLMASAFFADTERKYS